MGGALKGARMFERVNVPVLGIVENMAAFTDPASGARVAFFGEGGGQRLADEVGVPLLGLVAPSPGLAALAWVLVPGFWLMGSRVYACRGFERLATS